MPLSDRQSYLVIITFGPQRRGSIYFIYRSLSACRSTLLQDVEVPKNFKDVDFKGQDYVSPSSDPLVMDIVSVEHLRLEPKARTKLCIS